MKLQELNAEEMKVINGGDGDARLPNTENPTYTDNPSSPHPVSDGVGQTNESTYGTSDGPHYHHIP